MKRYRTLIITRREIKRLVSMREVMAAVESAFDDYGRGRVQMPPKLYIHLDKYEGDFRAMPGYVEGMDAVLKWVNVHPKNRQYNLPAVMAVIIVSDPKNGYPLCFMDGTHATNLRTGAAGGIAARYLARKDAKIAGFVGCGAQARSQLAALHEVFRIQEVRAWGHKPALIKKFVNDMKRPGLALRPAKDIKSCVSDCDIVVTTTPSRTPLVKRAWLKPGVHINAIGADAKGKQELEPAILKRAKIIVDSWEQASHSGEINVPLSRGILARKDIYADIGQIVAGKKKARRGRAEITVFDSTGLALQDVAIATLIYKKALKRTRGRWIRLID